MRGTPDRRDLTTYGLGRAVRLPDCDYVGDIDIHVTICAADGLPFADDRVAHMTCHNVEHYCSTLQYRLYGYTLMPSHLHVLLSPATSAHALSRWLNVFKSYTTNQYHQFGFRGRLWQSSANDHVCRCAETTETVLAYIVENPERAGLVTSWVDWPWTKVFTELRE